jgi:hypothetical protein
LECFHIDVKVPSTAKKVFWSRDFASAVLLP